MSRVITTVLWSIVPTLQIWREVRARGISPPRRVLRPLLVHSLARGLAVAGLVWAIWSSSWFGAAAIATTLLILGLLSESITKWMIKRWGGSNEREEKQ